MKAASLYTLLLACALAVPSSGQQKTYDWVQGNDETVRLDPGYYHTSPPYQPASGARSLHVDVDAQQPVTLTVVSAQAWNDASQRPDAMGNLSCSVCRSTWCKPPTPAIFRWARPCCFWCATNAVSAACTAV